MKQDPSSNDLDETEEYDAVSNRIQQDVWHDNFVPKYSAIATAEPSWLLLIGIWILFCPQIFIAAIYVTYGNRNDLADIVIGAGFLLYALLLVAILCVQTKRFIRAKRNPVTSPELDAE